MEKTWMTHGFCTGYLKKSVCTGSVKKKFHEKLHQVTRKKGGIRGHFYFMSPQILIHQLSNRGASQPERMPTNHFYLKDGRVEFAVDRIRNHYLGETTTYFLVKWLHYPYQTWEPLHHLNCPKNLHLYALKRDRLQSGLPVSGLSKIVNGTSESTLDQETAHSKTLALSLSGSWVRSKLGKRSSTSLSEESKWETIQGGHLH